MKNRTLVIAFMAILGIILISGCVEEKPEAEFCTKTGTEYKLSLEEAKQIASASECGEQGTLKDTYMCNEGTGTWWIDLDPNTEKKGCNPACVINVVTKQAEINWRCTGLLPESKGLTIDEAMDIARSSECTEKGNLTDKYIYNNISKTWWIDLDMKEEFKKDYCSPACVVNETTKTAEINWRCTGALPAE